MLTFGTLSEIGKRLWPDITNKEPVIRVNTLAFRPIDADAMYELVYVWFSAR